MSFSFDQELDCSGMACPMPILKTKKAVDALQTGQKDGDKFIFYIKRK
jgi:TusA-related sulfurtransferase